MSTHLKKEKLSQILKASLKSGDKLTLTFARNLHSEIRKKEIDDRIDLDDLGFEKVVSRLLKQRRKSLEQFEQGGRTDLVEKEKQEIQFLESWVSEKNLTA